MSAQKNLLELETLRLNLIEKSINSSSNFLRLSLYHNYFEKVILLNDPNIEEAFLTEFIEDYIKCIHRFEVWGVEPFITKKILELLKQVSHLKIASNYLDTLNSEILRIEGQKEKLELILDGNELDSEKSTKAFFPLIDNEAPYEFYGIVDSVTIKISRAADSNKFIIVPSETEIEKRIAEQCTQSWLLALTLLKRYVKEPYKFHEVIISFDKRGGFYEGNSLGIALTLSFLQSLLNFYNPSYLINIKNQSAFTGGVLKSGEVLCTSEEIIKRKVAAVFFSEINTFVFPKYEETYAYFSLTQLKQKYPKRKLKLIPVEDINDVLNRRDVVDIKKQRIIVRTEKFIKKNWISAVASVLFAILFSYLFVMDFDDNPANLNAEGGVLYVKNKNGKVLWTKLVSVSDPYSSREAKIVDIDNNNLNKIIICGERDPLTNLTKNSAKVVCYNSQGEEVWNYIFQDNVFSERERLNTEYTVNILDTITFEGQKSLLLIANNSNSFSSAIFRLDLQTGKRLSGTFWASGHIMDGTIKDIDTDNKLEIVGVGYENGFEDFVFFVYELDTLTKVRPTTEEYLIREKPIAEMKSYIRFSKTDFDNYYVERTPGYSINSFSFNENNKKFIFATSFPKTVDEPEVGYEINYNFKDINVVIDSDFRVQRDTLVANGLLNLPYTDTEEYKNIIKSKILYWKDGKWVKRDELD